MSAKVYIPTPLRSYVDDQEALELEGGTVKEVLNNLSEQYEGLSKHLFNEKGELRSFVNIYVNDEDIRYLQREDTPIQDNDTISIVPSIAGGVVDVASPPTDLSNEEIQRYSRHLIMPEVGLGGQKKLKQARVLCVGAGGLGSPLTLYLAAAGVGQIGIVDFDVVDFSNLQRQILHSTKDVGRSKLDSAREKLEGINPNVEIRTHEIRLSSENALDLFRQYDIVADGTDNFPTRYLVNDASVLTGKPNVYASIFRFEGQASVFGLKDGPCYRCLYPEPPPAGLVPSCAEGGVLGILPGLVGIIQATEVVKLILGRGESLAGRLLLFDALGMNFRELKLRKNSDCPLCGDHPTLTELIDYEQFCGMDEGQPQLSEQWEVSVEELKRELDQGSNLFILDVRNPEEYEISRLPNSQLIPLGDLLNRIHELDSARDIVVHCKSGMRSAQAIEILREAGFRKLRNLQGGIMAWSERIDPTVPMY
jgi:adenylyltransferase/sulfurtransferase